jgi:hypothetical protein
MSNPHDLKSLNTQLLLAKAQAVEAERELSLANQKLTTAKARQRALEAKLATLTSAEPTVTEHAILRYLERTYGLDLKELALQVLPDSVRQQVKALGKGKYPVGNSHYVVVKNNVVVTVLGKDGE